MMEKIFFALPGNEILTNSLVKKCKGEKGLYEHRLFPDNETYIKIKSVVEGKNVFLVCTLNHPDEKLLLLYFLSQTAKDLGAKTCCLVSPYLAYMRQDMRFKPGEGITSNYFASLISFFVDALITIDPHLHRRSALSEIYSVHTTVLHAADLISGYIKNNIKKPLIIGPDSESEQWVSAVARQANAPFVVLNKIRSGDNKVSITLPEVDKYSDLTPVLVDDIISTAGTMETTIGLLKNVRMKQPVCIGVHGLFSGKAYEKLISAGAHKIVTCNTIVHASNKISVDDLIAEAINNGAGI